MFNHQLMCVTVVCLLVYSLLLIFVVTNLYNTSEQNVYKEVPYATFMQNGGLHSPAKTVIQLENQMTKPTRNFDYEQLQTIYKNEACPLRNITSPKNSTTRTGLLSYPASGNTWTRHLIHQLTGFQTCPDHRPDACIVYKSHQSSATTMTHFDKAVIIIRNPLYSLKSFFHYKYGEQEDKKRSERNREERHKGYAYTSLFRSLKWTSHVANGIPKWKNSYISWFKNFKRNSLVIVYENLKQNVFRELLRIIKFLNTDVSPKDLWCTLVNQEGDYHRISRNLTETSVFTLFTQQQKEEVADAVCEVSNVARKMDIDLDISQYLETLSDTPNTACP